MHGLWFEYSPIFGTRAAARFSRGRLDSREDLRTELQKLANLYDISGDYNFKHGISLGLYFGWAQGGQVIKAIYPANSNGALGFTEFNYRF